MSANPMNIVLPVPSVTPGPEWAETINEAVGDTIPNHDHSSGKGLPITPAGMNINNELPMQDNDLTQVRSVRFVDQNGTLSETVDIGAVYISGGDLYYNNGLGTPVQITSGANLSATSLGGWTGLPSGSASAGFSADTFTLWKATGRYGALQIGELKLYNGDTLSPPNSINIKVPSGLANSLDITLPSVLPGTTSFLTITSAGVIAAGPSETAGITNAMLAGSISKNKLAPLGQDSAAILNHGLTGSWADITGLDVTLTTTGRPVMVMLQPVTFDTTLGTFEYESTSPLSPALIDLRCELTGASNYEAGYARFGGTTPGSGATALVSPSVYSAVFTPAAGTTTFQMQGRVTAGQCSLDNIQMVAFEL